MSCGRTFGSKLIVVVGSQVASSSCSTIVAPGSSAAPIEPVCTASNVPSGTSSAAGSQSIENE